MTPDSNAIATAESAAGRKPHNAPAASDSSHIGGSVRNRAETSAERPTRFRSIPHFRNWSLRRRAHVGRPESLPAPAFADARRRRRRPYPHREQEHRPSIPPFTTPKLIATRPTKPTLKLVILTYSRKPGGVVESRLRDGQTLAT